MRKLKSDGSHCWCDFTQCFLLVNVFLSALFVLSCAVRLLHATLRHSCLSFAWSAGQCRVAIPHLLFDVPLEFLSHPAVKLRSYGHDFACIYILHEDFHSRCATPVTTLTNIYSEAGRSICTWRATTTSTAERAVSVQYPRQKKQEPGTMVNLSHIAYSVWFV